MTRLEDANQEATRHAATRPLPQPLGGALSPQKMTMSKSGARAQTPSRVPSVPRVHKRWSEGPVMLAGLAIAIGAVIANMFASGPLSELFLFGTLDLEIPVTSVEFEAMVFFGILFFPILALIWFVVVIPLAYLLLERRDWGHLGIWLPLIIPAAWLVLFVLMSVNGDYDAKGLAFLLGPPTVWATVGTLAFVALLSRSLRRRRREGN